MFHNKTLFFSLCQHSLSITSFHMSNKVKKISNLLYVRILARWTCGPMSLIRLLIYMFSYLASLICSYFHVESRYKNYQLIIPEWSNGIRVSAMKKICSLELLLCWYGEQKGIFSFINGNLMIIGNFSHHQFCVSSLIMCLFFNFQTFLT
jgi:hypothetical protein